MYTVSKSAFIKLFVLMTVLVAAGYLLVYQTTLKKVDQKYKTQQASGKNIPINTADLSKDFVSLQQGSDSPQSGSLNISGDIGGRNIQGSTLTSTVQDGTSPINVASSTLVKNLNADMVDGKHAEDLTKPASNTTVNNITNTTSGESIPTGTNAQYYRGDKSWQTLNTSVVQGLGSLATASSINNGDWSGTQLSVANGGTGATDAAGAKTNLGLGNVENTALSTWGGSSNITTLGTVGMGNWNGSTIQDAYIGSSTNWNTAYSDRNKWDGGSTGLNAATGRTSLGLGSLATVNSINNGNWSGTQLSVANGGTGAIDAAGARTNLGLGTMATQDASAAAITGGSITGTTTFNAGTVTSSGAVQGTSLSATGLTQGSVSFVGAGGLISQDNSNLFWDNTGKRLGIGTAAPTGQLSIKSTSALEAGSLGSEMTDGTGWTSTGWTGSYAAGFTHAPGNTNELSRDVGAVDGNYYLVSWNFDSRTQGYFTVSLGDSTLSGYSGNQGWGWEGSSGSGSIGIKAVGTGPLKFNPTYNPDELTGSFDGRIYNISVKIITAYGSTISVQDSTSTAGVEVRSSLASLNNTFIGVGSGEFNVTGTNNTALGVGALQGNTTGTTNTAIGNNALKANTSGMLNTAVGYSALAANTSSEGYANSAFGVYALSNNTTGKRNTAIGVMSLRYNTTGYENTTVGVHAGDNNTTGYWNVATGMQTLQGNTTGIGNTAYGTRAMSNNVTGSSNVAVGNSALQLGTASGGNTAVGTSALYNNTANYNVAVGNNALKANTSGYWNTAIGRNAMGGDSGGNTTGYYNVALGYGAGVTSTAANANTTGSKNTYIGVNAGPGSSTQYSNSAAIGYNALVSQSNSMVLGGTGADAIKVGIGTAAPGATLQVTSGATGTIGQIVKAYSGQTADLFQIQGSDASVLAKIDASGNLTAKSASFTGTLSMNGHIITGNSSGSTTIAAGANAGTGASASISGNDTSGTITVTTGTGPAAGTLATVTFGSAYGSAPNVILEPKGSSGATLQHYTTPATTNFPLNSGNAPAASTTYTYSYMVMQ